MNGGRVTSSVRALGSQRFIASFTSHEPGNHTVQITFNGDTVPGKILNSVFIVPGILVLRVQKTSVLKTL